MSEQVAEPPKTNSLPRGFGTFKGVYIPSVLTILGVIMYLRMGWIVGSVGLASTLVIITISSIITFLTGLSIAATATNMKIKGGGAYYMVSRSFGVEAGAAIGFPLFLAQATGVSFYAAGFAESVHALFPQFSVLSIGLAALASIGILAYVSADFALKTQFVIFAIIIASLVSLFLGSGTTVTNAPPSQGAFQSIPFWVAFAVFFPAVTGIEAGISMSGDLEKPSKSLPVGTIAAVLTGFVVYLAIAVFLWASATKQDLLSDSMIMSKLAIRPEIIFAAIWGASLSSALGALLGAPRTLQALANDHVLPRFLGKGFGPTNDPRIATVITLLIALTGIYMGDLNTIAPVLSMFFLTSYGALNLIAGLESLIGNPSWRPTFRTPWVLSLVGAAGCFSAMFMIDSGASFVALAFSFAVFVVTKRRKLNTRWSDMRRSLFLFLARNSIYQLARYPSDARSWRPNLLTLVGSPTSGWPVIELSDAISHGKGFLTVANIVSQPTIEIEKIRSLENSIKDYLEKKNIPALVKVKASEDRNSAVENLLQDYGIGSLRPNTVVMEKPPEDGDFLDFSETLTQIYRLRANSLVFSASLTNGQNGSEERRFIEVWWGRKDSNATLMMALAYMVQTSPEWIGAKLIIRSLVSSEEERDGTLKSHLEFIKNSRLDADVDIHLIDKEQSRSAAILKFSRHSDLTFVGIGPPTEGSTADELSMEIDSLIRDLSKLKRVVFTMAGENISFKEIFT